jgi:hypothetical protein
MEAISTYFNAERAESLLFIAVAAIALAAAIGCRFVLQQPFFTGMAISLSVVALLQGVVGVTIYQRSPQDMARVQQMLRSAPQRLQTEEVPRMRVVLHKFKIYLAVELALLLLSLAVLAFATPGSLVRGVALGLALQAGFTAVLDLVAMRRGDVYLDWLLLQA